MLTHFEINVAKDGEHFFATREASLPTREKTEAVLKEIRRAFPASGGFEISVTEVQTRGIYRRLDDLTQEDTP
jgi:hypothetical protein